eukprot:TRINITY_DN19_c0_g1_i5.p1 TRINITY_DN19_c0_g1~~TRINITY_DN19_c0_g1_i5.p1  ORF type:complete len:257 (+),score=55.67 TRINITY_DN19_c0_g1_i5:45-773(+)
MKTLVLGGSGRTGKLVVQELLKANHPVRLLVRDRKKLPSELLNNPEVECVEGSITSLSDNQLEEYIKGCSTVVSCFGKNLTLADTTKGLKLLTTSTKRIHKIVKKIHQSSLASLPTRYILMNSALTLNKDEGESPNLAQWIVTSVLKMVMPPFRDNVDAAEYLRKHRHTPGFEWAIVRPGYLIDSKRSKASKYNVMSSPTGSLSETTLRINVADAMRRLVTSDECWEQWKGKMPVVFDAKKK